MSIAVAAEKLADHDHDHDHDHEYMVPDMVPDMVRASVLPLAEALSSEAIREEWSRLASVSDNVRAVHQTPSWCAHEALTGEPVRVALLRDASDKVIGVAPLQDTTFRLAFTKGRRNPWAKSFRGLVLLGDQPLLPPTTTTTMSTWCPTWCPTTVRRGSPDPAVPWVARSGERPQREVYNALFRAIHRGFPGCDCLFIWAVFRDSYLWEYLENSAEARALWQPYLPDRPVGHYLLSLPSTFADYLAKFTSKSRHNLKRQVANFQRLGSPLELVRVDSPGQASEFVQSATAVAAASWQQTFLKLPLETPLDRAASLRDFAEHGLLRSYLLKCGGRPCAYWIGFQLGSTYILYETAYDPEFAQHSPGKVLLFLLLQGPVRAGHALGPAAEGVLRIGRLRLQDLLWRLDKA